MDKILKTGLWRYSRHPNYFGEATMLWGIWILSLGSGGIWTIIAPIAMTVNLRYLFGVPYPEKMKLGDREWQEYCKETNVFVPWKPRDPAQLDEMDSPKSSEKDEVDRALANMCDSD